MRADFVRTLRFWADRGVDGFRIDVAHVLIEGPLRAAITRGRRSRTMRRPDGPHPLWDRDDVHEVYARVAAVFDEYDPPRTAVAEAWVDPSRRARYAAAESLGQAFNFELLDADWRAADFRGVIDSGLADMRESGSTTTWLLGCHDSPRVATRYGLPFDAEHPRSSSPAAGCSTGGREPVLDRALGERRARAAALFVLALPGSTYVYQGEELGLHEVAELPAEALQDPMATRSDAGERPRRLPRAAAVEPTGPSFGFGPGPASPPQPDWFASSAVSVQAADPGLDPVAVPARTRRCDERSKPTTPSPGWTSPTRTSCASAAAIGTAWPTSDHSPSPCRPARCWPPAPGSTAGVLPPDTTVWFRPA